MKFQRLPSGSYRCQVADPTNPERKLSLVAPSEAELAARVHAVRQTRRDLRLGAIDAADARALTANRIGGTVTVKDAWQRYTRGLSPRWKPKAEAIWLHRLAPSFNGLPVVELTAARMREWEQRQIREGMAPKTILNAFECLRAAVNLQVHERRLASVPWYPFRVVRPKLNDETDRPEACRSVEEFERLVLAARAHDAAKVARGHYADLAHRVAVIGLCGLRQGEAAGLGWDDLDLEGVCPRMHVRHQACDGWTKDHPDWTRPLDPPKDGERKIALHPSAVYALLHQRDNLLRHGRYSPTGPVFPGKAGWRTHADTIDGERDFRPLVRAAGLPNPERWVVHSLRHSFASLEVVASGGDLESTRKRTGHSTVKMLETYLHAAGRGLPQSRIPLLSPTLIPPRELPSGLLSPAPAEEPAAGAAVPLGAELGEPVGQPLEVVAVAALPPSPDMARRFADLVNVTPEVAARYAVERQEALADRTRRAKEKHLGRAVCNFAEAHRVWVQAGSPGVRPPDVTVHADKAYQRAYTASRRRGETEEAARRKGAQARRGVLANWARWLGRGG